MFAWCQKIPFIPAAVKLELLEGTPLHLEIYYYRLSDVTKAVKIKCHSLFFFTTVLY